VLPLTRYHFDTPESWLWNRVLSEYVPLGLVGSDPHLQYLL
jgi:hypothetical protein